MNAVGLLTAMLMVTGCTGQRADELVAARPWRVTVYYTAVESFHHDSPVPVRGCPQSHCVNGNHPLGDYPGSFVAAVHDEGTGRITSGSQVGRFLNWSHDIGFWLDTAPRDAHGRPLEPFRSAAAEGLPDGTKLRLTDCGRQESGEPAPAEVCAALRGGRWKIVDRFTPGAGGPRHIDLYIGEESAEEFTTAGPSYVSLDGAIFTAEG
jgi:hypothetical protein